MMKRNLLRPVAIGIATLSTVATMAIGAVSSQAASVGSLSFAPASGNDGVTPSVTASAACPSDPNDVNVQATLSGPGFPAGGVVVVGNSPQSIYTASASGGITVPFAHSFQNFAASQNPPVTLSGTYAVSVVCQSKFGTTTFGSFDGSVVFTNTGQAAGSIPYAAVVSATNYTTTTALASAPASPVNTGVPVAFTAVVASTPAGGATGTVQLLDGTTAVGSPTAVDASGQAVISIPFTTAGTHSLTAAFTGSAANVGNSVSTAIVYTVNQAPADATTTSLAISPASATTADTVKLTATVADTATAANTPAGTVQFADGATLLGNPVALSSGSASISNTYAVGAHNFTATYIPSSATTWNASASASQPYTVTAFAGSSTSETILTTVAAGSLVISVSDGSSVVLPTPTLNADATYLTTSGPIHTVTVTDTRAGNPGWTASGQVSDFHNTSGPTNTPINGYNLGWVPAVTTHSAGQTVNAGATVAAATPPVVADPATTPAFGLKTARTLASAAAGAGTGTATLDAGLTLNIPTTTVAGTYSAVLTLTAI
jgi:Bacterial Ig-like domain (group 3)